MNINILLVISFWIFFGCQKNSSKFLGQGAEKKKSSSEKASEVILETSQEETPTQSIGEVESEGEMNTEEPQQISPEKILPNPGEICGGWGNTSSIIEEVSGAAWGCAEPSNNCPSDTIAVRTADNNTYVLCLYKGNDPDFTLEKANEIGKKKAGEICGGARATGKYQRVGGNDCIYPSTSDQSCDRWGCATFLENGDGSCPDGTLRLMVSSNTSYPIYYLCILDGIKKSPGTGEICGASGAADGCNHCPTEYMKAYTSMHGDHICIAGKLEDLRDNYSKLWKTN